MLDENFFENIDNEKKAYWLGFIAADGCVSRNRNSLYLSIGLSARDIEHLKKFKNDTGSSSKIIIYDVANRKGQSYKSCSIQIYNKKICSDLISHGIIERKSLKLKFNQNFHNQELIKHFIRGYFDGDGCISVSKKEKNKVKFSLLGTQDFLDGCSRFLSEKIKIKYKNSKNYINRNYYELEWSGRINCKKILDYLYEDSNIFLDRKYKKYNEIYKNYIYKETRKKIKRIDNVGNIIVYNSIADAEKLNNISEDYLRKALNKKNFQKVFCKKYFWELHEN